MNTILIFALSIARANPLPHQLEEVYETITFSSREFCFTNSTVPLLTPLKRGVNEGSLTSMPPRSRQVLGQRLQNHFETSVPLQLLKATMAGLTRRIAVERFFAWVDNFRQLVARRKYYKNNFLGTVQLACILILLRRYFVRWVLINLRQKSD
jgi:hypothetical protein